MTAHTQDFPAYPSTASRSTLRILNGRGDTKMTWSVDNEAEVKAVKSTFKELKGAGYVAYTVDPDDGTRGEVINEFDPEAGMMIMHAPLAGG
jgi:hypothetical protein